MANRRPTRREGYAPARGHRPRHPVRHGNPPASPHAHEGETGDLERLQKVLAHAGIGSRRACEEVILQGRVTVDGQVVRELGTKVDPRRQQVAVDGQKIHQERTVYFAVNKPKGYVSTNYDPSGRPRVVDLLPEVPQRVYTVGRLDEMSTGLMILTNDGALANKLAHPKYGVEKVYRAVVAGTPDREVLTNLTEGVWLVEGKVRAHSARAIGTKGEATILELVLAEGKNREVRRMLAKLGHKVMTLIRTSVGPIGLKGLAPGAYRPLSSHEVDLLRKVAAGIPVPTARTYDRKPLRPSGRSRASEGSARPPRPASEGPARRPAPQRPGVASQDKPRRATGPSPAAHGTSGGTRRPASAGPPPAPRGSSGGARRGPATGRPRQGQERLILPEGPPPSQRRAAAPKAPQSEPPTRRIIGLDLENQAGGPPRPRTRRPPPKKRHPPAALGGRKRRSSEEGEE